MSFRSLSLSLRIYIYIYRDYLETFVLLVDLGSNSCAQPSTNTMPMSSAHCWVPILAGAVFDGADDRWLHAILDVGRFAQRGTGYGWKGRHVVIQRKRGMIFSGCVKVVKSLIVQTVANQNHKIDQHFSRKSMGSWLLMIIRTQLTTMFGVAETSNQHSGLHKLPWCSACRLCWC